MTNFRRLSAFTSAAALCSAAAFADSHSWSYTGKTGPEHWGQLAAAFEVCEKGVMQSPIDLDQANAVGDVEVSVDYQASPLKLIRTDKGIQADFEPGSYMTSGGKVFNLIQVHFHTPSEHTFSGETYPLVAHFVHATDEGALGVLGVLFEQGDANPELAKILAGATVAGKGAAAVAGESLDPNGILPDELKVYRYMGSLTTPPCSEAVNWHVVEDTLEASSEQLQAFASMMGMNARPVLPLNGRLLVEPQ